MTIVVDKNGKEWKIPYAIDVQAAIKSGEYRLKGEAAPVEAEKKETFIPKTEVPKEKTAADKWKESKNLE